MPLPEIEQRRVEKLLGPFLEGRVPPDAREEIRLFYRITGNKVVVIESRPFYADPAVWTEMPIAQLEYSAATKAWSLYAYDRNS